jgi:hypothetical protein
MYKVLIQGFSMLPSEVAFGFQLQNTIKEIFLSKNLKKNKKVAKIRRTPTAPPNQKLTA